MTARPPAAVRQIAAHRVAFTATAVMVLATAVGAAAVTAFASAVTRAAVRTSLAPGRGTAIVVTDPAPQSGAAAAGRTVQRVIRRALPGVPVSFSVSLQSDPLNLPPGGPGGPGAQVQVISLPRLPSHAVLTAGSWPAAVPRAAAAGVAVPRAVARLLHLAPGTELTVRDSITHTAATLRVTGIYRPSGPAAPYWSLSPIGGAGVTRQGGFSIYGPLVASQATAGRLGTSSATWLALPDFAARPGLSLSAASSRLTAALGGGDGASSLAGLSQSAVASTLPGRLAALATALMVARSQLLIGSLILLVIAGTAVAVSVRLLASQREPEIELLAARGAARRQLAARGVTEGLLLAIPAAIAGPLLGRALAPALTSFGPLASAGMRLVPGLPPAAWLASAGVAAGCGVIVALPWLRRPLSAVGQRVRRGRQQAVAGAVTAGADLALIAVAGLAGWQLAQYQSPVTTGVAGTLGVDPVLSAAPVLMLAAGTVVTLRLLPLLTRLADAAARRGRGITAAVAAWQLSRRPLRQAGPALLAVLAVATVVLTLAAHSSWQRSVADQAGFAVGAGESVTLPPAAPLPPGAVGRLTGAPGVRAATPAVHAPVSLPGGQIGTLVAVDPRAAASIVPPRADPAALRTLAAGIPRAAGTVLPGRPSRLLVTAELGRTPITSPLLTLQLTDAAGAGYQLQAGALPADGRPHRFSIAIPGGQDADYPLRYIGFSLSYVMPVRPGRLVSITVGPVQVPGSGQGPAAVLPPARLAASIGAQAGGGVQKAPSVHGAPHGPGGAVTVAFNPGTGLSTLFGAGPAGAGLSVSTAATVGALPGLATPAFLAATGGHLGSAVDVSVNGVTVPVRLTGTVSAFPTVDNTSAVVVDQAGLQDALRAAGTSPLPVTQWWLATSGPVQLTGLPAGSSVTRQAAVAHTLATLPLSVGPQQALLLVAVAAVVLALAGFMVAVATAKDRARDMALLDALGTPASRVAGLMCLEQAMLAVTASAAGLLLGALLARLIIPAVSLTALAARPQPPVLVQVPWALAVGAAVLVALVPVAATAAAAYRGVTTARLRLADET